jgi:hypothetical protein
MSSSTKPLQNINEDSPLQDTCDKTPSSEENEEYDEENNKDNESATVHIDQDSTHISLSACNYDHSLINYLQTHPLTTE